MSRILLAMLALNAFTTLLYGLDKIAARNGWRRIPEITLHLLALLGGWPGAFLAQKVFRHKTGKRAFQRVFGVTVLVNAAFWLWFIRR